MAISKELEVSKKRVAPQGKIVGWLERSGTAYVGMLTGKPDMVGDPKTSEVLRREALMRAVGGGVVVWLAMAMLMFLAGPLGRTIADAAWSFSKLGACAGFVAILSMAASGVVALAYADGSSLRLTDDRVMWLKSERNKPGCVREFCAKAALHGRGLTKGECDELMALEKTRRREEKWKRMDALSSVYALDLSGVNVQKGWACTVAWVVMGDGVRSVAMSSTELAQAKVCAIAIWAGVGCLGAGLAGGALVGMAGALAVCAGMVAMVLGFFGITAAVVVDSEIAEESLDALLAAAMADRELAKRILMIRIRGREVSQVEADHLLYEVAMKERRARAAELMISAREDVLAARLAAPSIERAARGNEGSRLMLDGLSSREVEDDSAR